MKTKANYSPNGDEARFEAAIADFEAYEALFAAEERIQKMLMRFSFAAGFLSSDCARTFLCFF